MDREAVKKFVQRDWNALENAKLDYWAERSRAEGLGVLLAAADGLRDFARSIHPGWPSPSDRWADLRHHVRLKRCLDAARDAFAGR